MNTVLDGQMPEVAAFPERDRIMFELLYGCGIRNSELVVFEGCAHAPIYEKVEEFNRRTLEFLGRQVGVN